MKGILEKNKKFIEEMKKGDKDFFEKLSQGQHPDTFIISCSDSRVSPSVIMQSSLGQIFVHRNIANQVIQQDLSLNAGLYYALKHLKVKEVAIIGHTDCGGIKAAYTTSEDAEFCVWTAYIRENLPKEDFDKYSLDDLVKINVLAQVRRVQEHPIYKKYGQNTEVVGYVFHIKTGTLETLDPSDPVEPSAPRGQESS